MAIDKLTPRYLNKDSDERLVKNVEMTDALNLRISTEDDGDGMVIKNAYGNTEVSFETPLPSGTNKVIGSTAVESSGSIYFFVWNSNEDHCIYKYSTGSNTARLVYKDSILGFSENGFVQSNIVIDGDRDDLLYFNDSRSEPKKINASKALRGDYPAAFTSGTDEEKLLFLTVAKQPPLKAPTFNIVNNPDVKDNRINDKIFQFAYRYVYSDGEYSALSPYSAAAVSIAQLRDGFNTESAKNFYNQINVFIRNTKADVEKILVYARNGNTGVFYEIEEIDNNGSAGVSTVNFTNSTVGSAVSDTDLNKLFDNVPQLADSQEIVEGRLMYGGYTEGFDNLDIDVNLISNYKKGPVINNADASYSVLSGAIPGENINIIYNFPSVFTKDSKVFFNLQTGADSLAFYTQGNSSGNLEVDLSVSYANQDGTGASADDVTVVKDGALTGIAPINVYETINIPAGTTDAQAEVLVNNHMIGRKYVTSLFPLSNASSNKILKATGTLFTTESGELSGRANYEIKAGTNGLRFELNSVVVYLSSFFVGGEKKDIITSTEYEIDADDLVESYDNKFLVNGIFSTEGFKQEKCFKSGSSHKLGIVYYDDRGRMSGVQECGDVFVNALNDRTAEDDHAGPGSIVMRVSHDPPEWAYKWAPVYVGRGSTDCKITTGISGAFLPYRTDGEVFFENNKKIYLSLNGTLEKENSYEKSFGADISYAFEKGDKLRIIKNNEGVVLNEFNVVDFVTLVDNDENPILDKSSNSTIYATTGSFVVIENNSDATNFTASNVSDNTSYWYDDCVVEIYNDLENTEKNIYYEIGKSLDVLSGEHVGERVTMSPSFFITSQSGSDVEGYTTDRIFKGDVITSGIYSITIGNVYKDGSNYYFHAEETTNSTFTLNVAYAGTVTNNDKVIEITQGDAYFRPRYMFTVARPLNVTAKVKYLPYPNVIVESLDFYNVSDFFDSKSSSIGRPIAYIPNAKRYKRKASITYSDVFTIDGSRNGLSSFNLSLANYKDLSYEEGTIYSLISYNQKLYFIQESGCGALAVNRNVITTTQGDGLVALSTNILQAEQYYAGKYGTQNPESVAHKDGTIYFTDVNAGKIVSLGSPGIRLISDINMDSYFTNRLSAVSNYQPKLIPAGIDTDNEEYIVSTETLSQAGVRVDAVYTSPGTEYNYIAQIDSTGTKVVANIAYNPLAVWNFSSDPRAFDSTCDYFDDSIGALVYLDDLVNGGSVYVNVSSQINGLYGIATNSNLDFFVTIRVDTTLPGFTFDNPHCNTDDDGYITPGQVISQGFTTAYSYKNKVWTTEYSFVPEDIVSVHNKMYSFKDGKMYVHDETASRNTFYGASAASSIVEVISRKSPSAIKTYESISLEGTKAWDTTISTTDQSAVIDDTSYSEKEGFYYTYVHGATTGRTGTDNITITQSTDEFFGLGVVSSVSSNTITFKNDIDSMSFPLGTSSFLYKVDGAQLTALSLTASSISGSNQLTCNTTVAGLIPNDVVVLVADSSIEGDQIRDYFAKIKLTKTDTNPIELYAVNAVVTDSKAHN